MLPNHIYLMTVRSTPDQTDTNHGIGVFPQRQFICEAAGLVPRYTLSAFRYSLCPAQAALMPILTNDCLISATHDVIGSPTLLSRHGNPVAVAGLDHGVKIKT